MVEVSIVLWRKWNSLGHVIRKCLNRTGKWKSQDFSLFSTQGKQRICLYCTDIIEKNNRKTIWFLSNFKKLSSIFHNPQNTYIFHGINFSTVFLQTSSTENFTVTFGFLLQCSVALAYTKLFPIYLFQISFTSCSRLGQLLFDQFTMVT